MATIERAFNQTRMELKPGLKAFCKFGNFAFNQTRMELKQIKMLTNFFYRFLLIRPEWN